MNSLSSEQKSRNMNSDATSVMIPPAMVRWKNSCNQGRASPRRRSAAAGPGPCCPQGRCATGALRTCASSRCFGKASSSFSLPSSPPGSDDDRGEKAPPPFIAAGSLGARLALITLSGWAAGSKSAAGVSAIIRLKIGGCTGETDA